MALKSWELSESNLSLLSQTEIRSCLFSDMGNSLPRRKSFISVKDRCTPGPADGFAYERLFRTSVGSIPVKDVERGLVPVELKYQPQTPVLPLATECLPQVKFGHESSVAERPSPQSVYLYHMGELNTQPMSTQRPHTPLRIVRHRVRGRKHSSKNPEKAPPNVSRNVLGGFYSN